MKYSDRKDDSAVEGTVVQFPVNCIRICLDQEMPEPVGCICGVALAEDIPFSGNRELIVGIDQAFDRIGQPQPHQIIRSFRETDQNYKSYNAHPERHYTDSVIHARRGTENTLDLVMISRRHAEWQGLIKTTDGKVAHRFNSTLAFLEWLTASGPSKTEKGK